MGIQDFGTIGADASLKQVINALADLQDTLNFLLNGNLDVKNLRADSVNADRIKANTITADRILAGTITALEIAVNTITADRMNVTELSAISANIGTVTAGSITSNSTIDVGTDLHVGGSAYLNPTNLLSTYYLTPSMYIYADIPAGTLRLVAPNGVYANGIRIDVTPAPPPAP